MTQLALVLPLPLARKRDPATSHDAAAKAKTVKNLLIRINNKRWCFFVMKRTWRFKIPTGLF